MWVCLEDVTVTVANHPSTRCECEGYFTVTVTVKRASESSCGVSNVKMQEIGTLMELRLRSVARLGFGSVAVSGRCSCIFFLQTGIITRASKSGILRSWHAYVNTKHQDPKKKFRE